MHIEVNNGDRRRMVRQTNAPTLGAFFNDKIDTQTGCIADADTCAEEQVAQHTAPRLLAVGSTSANQPTGASNTRVPLQNCFDARVIEQTRRDTRHIVRAEGAAACIAGSKPHLLRQICEAAFVEGYCHCCS